MNEYFSTPNPCIEWRYPTRSTLVLWEKEGNDQLMLDVAWRNRDIKDGPGTQAG
jgi:hypothetical protein